jgi:hypothetical protein
VGHPGLGFGLIGGLVAAADTSAKSKEFTALAKQKSVDYVAEYQKDLAQALEKAGYTVKILKVKRDTPEKLMTSYEGLDDSVDAYLDQRVSSGYMCASAVADYIPSVVSSAKLVKRSTKEIVYQEVISYGYELKYLQAISLPAESKYFFNNYDLLKSDMDKAVAGLRAGFPAVAQQVAADIRK